MSNKNNQGGAKPAAESTPSPEVAADPKITPPGRDPEGTGQSTELTTADVAELDAAGPGSADKKPAGKKLTDAQAAKIKKESAERAAKQKADRLSAEADAAQAAEKERAAEAKERDATEQELADTRNRLAALEAKFEGLAQRTDAPAPDLVIRRIRANQNNPAVAERNQRQRMISLKLDPLGVRPVVTHSFRVTPSGNSAKKNLPELIVDGCYDESDAKSEYVKSLKIEGFTLQADVVEVTPFPDMIALV